MKLIPRNTHAILDYIIGALLIVAPWLLGFADRSAATYTPVIIGAATIIYSLLTNYELGMLRVIPFRTHLTLDAVAGFILAASPWLFNFSQHVYWPHLVVGLMEIVVVALTNREEAMERLRTA